MLARVENITVSFGNNTILKDVTAAVNKQARIGIIGANGAGKSTLLNVFTKSITPDKGEVIVAPNVNVGFVEQDGGVSPENTILAEMRTVFKKEIEAVLAIEKLDPNESKTLKQYNKLITYIETSDAYNIDYKIHTVLNGLGFKKENDNLKISALSGGERTRLKLAKLLLLQPELIVLDEPTNHLDLKSISWLEQYLAEYKGSVLIVTHDRYFLDNVANEIWEIEFGSLNQYKGGYSDFKAQKAERLLLLKQQYDKYLEQKAKLEDYIARNLVRASTTKMAQSRQKMLDKLVEPPKPEQYSKHIYLKFDFEKESYFDLLDCKGLSLNIGGKQLFSALSFQIKRGDKVAVIGDNGAGKTTLLKALLGQIEPDKGEINWGRRASVGYFAQNQEFDSPNQTVLDYVWAKHPSMKEQDIRTKLGNLLIGEKDIAKRISELSGGERARMQLCCLMLENKNTLILDEPTNHLDMSSKEYLEAALCEFKGTLIIVSHDRYLLSKVPNKIINISSDGCSVFSGNYSYYIEKLKEQAFEPVKEKPRPQTKYKDKEQRAKEAFKRNQLNAYENEIQCLENEISAIEKQINDAANDYLRLNELCKQIDKLKQEHEDVLEKWLILKEEQNG